MEIRYELTPEEFALAASACDRLDPVRPVAMGVRWLSAVAAAISLAVAIGSLLASSPSAAGCSGAFAVLAAAFFALTSDRLRLARTTPAAPVRQGVRFTDRGIVDLVTSGGERTHAWTAVERVVDLGWAWFVGVGGNEWMVIPRRVVPPERLEFVPAELRRRTAKEIEPLP